MDDEKRKFEEFVDSVRHLRYWLNEVDSLDFVGLSPLWYRAHFRKRFQELIHDLYNYSLYPDLDDSLDETQDCI